MTSRRRALAVLAAGALAPLSLLLLGSGPNPNFGDPLPKLTPIQQNRFFDGKNLFNQVQTPATGLGPVFNNVSCLACHSGPAPGGGSTILITRFGRMSGGQFDPMTNFGGPMIQSKGIDFFNGVNFVGEVVPPDATIVARRRTTPIFGLGLVGAVPDQTFLQLAQHESQFTPDTAGRVNVVIDQASGEEIVGRFGWKAQHGSLFSFAGDSFVNELGITSPLDPDENCPQGNCALLAANPAPTNPNFQNNDGLQVVAEFMSFLAPPPPLPLSSSAKNGARVFAAIGCASCHVPSLQTGTNSIAALNKVTFFPYSDFLLHDMGGLNDGIAQSGAGQREMRTRPLWGVRVMTRFLHDGRAKSLSQAILAHDGQGVSARIISLSSKQATRRT